MTYWVNYGSQKWKVNGQPLIGQIFGTMGWLFKAPGGWLVGFLTYPIGILCVITIHELGVLFLASISWNDRVFA